VLALSGCATPGHASASPSADPRAAALKFSQCMRDHGITGFPDPDGNGAIGISAGTGVDPSSQTFQDAQNACQKYLSQIGGGPGPGGPVNGLKFSQCMRAHGVTDFPDPNPNNANPSGGPATNQNTGSGPGSGSGNGIFINGQSIDLNDPTVKAAFDACKSLLGSPGQPSSTKK
jgi:hypothetical protein